jgi:predicted nuclease of restriction endonuclease-like (RecB) superfamily
LPENSSDSIPKITEKQLENLPDNLKKLDLSRTNVTNEQLKNLPDNLEFLDLKNYFIKSLEDDPMKFFTNADEIRKLL